MQDGLFVFKVDLDGHAQWARLFDYSAFDWIFISFRERGMSMIEMDGFLYFTACTGDASGTTDLLLAKIDPNDLASDSCAYFSATPVETFSVLNPVQETQTLSFRNVLLDFASVMPTAKSGQAELPDFVTLCEQTCEPAEGCDVKTNGCVTFELLSIAVDGVGRRHYRVRFSNDCADQNLNCLAIQLPPGTTAVGPSNGSVYQSGNGRDYTVRNPNSSPFHSIRFSAQGAGLGPGEWDEFEYVLKGHSQPHYINVFACLWPGPSYEAHLNVFNCPVQQLQDVQDRGDDPGQLRVSVSPNPATDLLTVLVEAAGVGRSSIPMAGK